jgi:hypothetical protein
LNYNSNAAGQNFGYILMAKQTQSTKINENPKVKEIMNLIP